MSVKSQLVKCYCTQDLNCHCKPPEDSHGKTTQFVKLNNKSRIKNGLGHSQMLTNNFSRRNSDATNMSTVSSTNSTVNLTRTAESSTGKCCTHKFKLSNIQPQKSWSLPRFANDNDNMKSNKYEFTEQRCNYERNTSMTQHRQQQPWSSEQLLRSSISNSRIPTCSIVHHHHNDVNNDDDDDKTAKNLAGDAIDTVFLALREFRLNNSKDCFGDPRQQELYLMRAHTSEILTLTPKKSTSDCSDQQLYGSRGMGTTNSKQLKDNKANLLKSSKPYATRQRLLRQQLAKELPNKVSMPHKIKNMGLNKSLALSYQ